MIDSNGHAVQIFKHFCLFSILLLVPHFAFVSAPFSSLAIGILMVMPVIIFAIFTSIINLRFKFQNFVLASLVLLFIFFSAFSGYIFSGNLKPMYSLLLMSLGLVVFYGYQFLEENDFSVILRVFQFLVFFLVILGWVSLFASVSVFNYGALEKPVFPFSEQSHYALTLGLLVVALVSVSGKAVALFWILNILSLSLIFPSLTLLVFCLVSIVILLARIRNLYLVPLFFCLSVLFVFFVIYLMNSDEYFASRLDFSNLTNLTTLVWVQGWLLAFLNFVGTLGLGLGFNALGLDSTSYPEITEVIYSNTGRYFNLNDGGFLASKLISEFGALGALLCLSYFFWLLRAPFLISALYSRLYKEEGLRCQPMIAKKILATAIIFGFGVEFFLRGVGYFSVTLLLAIAAIIYFIKCDILK